jgi:hypothetical protein
VQVNPALNLESRPTRDGGFSAMSAVLALSDRPSAVVCYNDVVAIGAMLAAARRGLVVGRDIAIVGFDDTSEARHVSPALTTIAIDPVGLGERAAAMLLERIKKHSAEPNVFIGSVDLIIRESCGAYHRARRRRLNFQTRDKTIAFPRILSPDEAAALVPDRAIVTVSSSSGLGCPDAVLEAIGRRFDASGHPKALTTLHPIAAGDMWGIKGNDHLAKPGLLARTLGGSYPSGPSSAAPPEIWKMISGNVIPAYNIPSGILFDMHREAAAKRPGVLTKIGMDTFVDPKHQGCAMNALAAAEPVVRRVEFDGEDWLYVRSIVPNVAVIRATTADERGNLSYEHEGGLLGPLD